MPVPCGLQWFCISSVGRRQECFSEPVRASQGFPVEQTISSAGALVFQLESRIRCLKVSFILRGGLVERVPSKQFSPGEILIFQQSLGKKSTDYTALKIF